MKLSKKELIKRKNIIKNSDIAIDKLNDRKERLIKQ